jgi:hypothetical protein
MSGTSSNLTRRLITGILCVGASALPMVAQSSIRSVKVLGSKEVVEIEVEATDRIVPQTRVLTGPDRLVIDFPNARPSDQLRSQSVDRGEVKDVRVGLFQSKPPVTRVVLDLKTAQSFQVFPYGRTVMIKVVGAGSSGAAVRTADYSPQGSSRPGLVTTNFTTSAEPIQSEAPRPPLQVSYQHGMLAIHSDKATLSEVLYAIQQKTGADIAIPAGAEQEKVAAEVEPAPAPEVLARLLNGSRFNFLILSSPNDPNKLDRVILSTRGDGSFIAPPPAQGQSDDGSDDDEPAIVRNQPQQPQPDTPQVPPRPEQVDPGPAEDQSNQNQ